MTQQSIIKKFKEQADQFPQKKAYIFLEEGEEKNISFKELDQKAEAMAAQLQGMSIAEPIVICLPPGIDFKISLLACLYAGIVIVPLCPPNPDETKAFTVGPVFDDTQAKVMLTAKSMKPYLSNVLKDEPYFQGLQIISKEDLPPVEANAWQEPKITEETVAFCSYTSGTTGQPKGVIITHGNFLTSIQDISLDLAVDANHVLCTLFNHYHIITALWEMVFNLKGGQTVYLPLQSVLDKPIRLLRTLSDYKVNILMGVNLTLDLCVNKIQDDNLHDIDLSNLTLLVGGDKVKTELLEQFIAKYKASGFQRESVQSRYGQAEGFGFTSSVKGEYPRIESISQQLLTLNKIEPSQDRDDQIDLVTSGKPLKSVTIKIVDPNTLQICPSEEIGEVWVKGKAIGKGYWNRVRETEQTFNFYLQETQEGPFLRTGDMGYLNKHGELFLTGRLKEMLTIKKRHYYPEQIEKTVRNAHKMLQSITCAAFPLKINLENQLVIAAEFETVPKGEHLKLIIAAIQKNIRQCHELEVYDIVILKQNMIPRTKTGKIKRNQCHTMLKLGFK
ncbi:MAG: AMP-binding protein [Candidatus Parabeggiatoa sp.]|nr:AMP-binding protein [Candidatus Parabeggiatoa sp.]